MPGIGRIAFLGTGAFGVPLLEPLSRLADELLVISQPDRPAGRGMRRRSGPVVAWASRRGIPVVTPPRLRSAEGRAVVRAFAPDGLLLAAYGQLVPDDLLAIGRLPPLNVHPSLLPRHRGAAPVQGAILAGDPETGVTLIRMTAQLDAGPIVGQWRITLRGDEDAPALEARLAELAAVQVPRVLREWASGSIAELPQDEARATYTLPLRRDDGRIDWTASAVEIDRQVRALQPWPGTWTEVLGRRLHVRRAAAVPTAEAVPPGTVTVGERVEVSCGRGSLALVVVQPEARPPMPAADWLRGLRGASDARLVLGGSVDEA